MAVKKAAPRRCDCGGASVPSPGRNRDNRIVTDWDRGTFWAGLVLGIAFALMGIVGGQLGW